MGKRGTLTLFRLGGVPVRAHWSLPLGVFLFSGFRVAPGAWLGVLGLILAHELGHALLVHRAGLANLGIEISGLGGQCVFAGEPTPTQRAAIAWGGVLAQLPFLALGGAWLWVLGPPSSVFLTDLLDALVRTNALLIAINLIPFPPLDGAEAWPFFGRWRADRRRRRKWKEKLSTPPGVAAQDPGPLPAPRSSTPKSSTPKDAPSRSAAPQTLAEALREADERKNT